MQGFFFPSMFQLCLCYLLFIIPTVKHGIRITLRCVTLLCKSVNSGVVHVTMPPRGHTYMFQHVGIFHPVQVSVHDVLMYSQR